MELFSFNQPSVCVLCVWCMVCAYTMYNSALVMTVLTDVHMCIYLYFNYVIHSPCLRVVEKYLDTEMSKFAEYCATSLQRTKRRAFAPSRNEIIACLVSMSVSFSNSIITYCCPECNLRNSIYLLGKGCTFMKFTHSGPLVIHAVSAKI